MTSDDQWRRIRFPKDELGSGAMGQFFMDSLLPAIEELDVDFNTVAIFDVDDSEGAKYLYLSPGAVAAFLTLALTHGAEPCERPAPESAVSLYSRLSARGEPADADLRPRARSGHQKVGPSAARSPGPLLHTVPDPNRTSEGSGNP